MTSLFDILQCDDLCNYLFKFLIVDEINLSIYVLKFVCTSFLATVRSKHFSKSNKYKFCPEAASSGNVKLLEWVRNVGLPWDERVCSNAALNGHLEVLKWAKEHGCEE